VATPNRGSQGERGGDAADLPRMARRPQRSNPNANRLKEPKRHTLTLTSHSVTHHFLLTMTKNSLFINPFTHPAQKEPKTGQKKPFSMREKAASNA
jgi:hypothetical protein